MSRVNASLRNACARCVACCVLAASPGALADPPANTAETEASARSASQVMQRAVDAVGPASSVKFVRAEGTIEGPDGRSTIELLSSTAKPTRLIIRQRLADGRLLETGCNGELAWMRGPRDETVQLIECSAVIATGAGLLPTRMMFALADRFPIRSMGPREMRDGKACERLELEDRDGAHASAWFDAASGRLLEIRTQDRKPGAPPSILRIEAWTTVGQLTLPTTISARKGDAVTRSTFTRISVDPIPDADFAPPKELAKPVDPGA